MSDLDPQQVASRETGLEMPCFPASDLLWVQITQSYPNRLRFWILPSPESPCHDVIVYYESIKRELNKRLKFDSRCDARLKMGDGGGFHTPCADFSRPVEELEYSCLLKSTFKNEEF